MLKQPCEASWLQPHTPCCPAGATAAPPPPCPRLLMQVVALRRANPGVLLVVEVGYKFR